MAHGGTKTDLYIMENLGFYHQQVCATGNHKKGGGGGQQKPTGVGMDQ
jgi:hypothetical protein